MTDSVFSLTGKVAVVTGASGLLGREHCKALASAGATVIACDILPAACLNIFAEHETKHHVQYLDITNTESVNSLKTFVLDTFGSVDILVNNAAINDTFENPLHQAEYSKFENYPLEAWQKSIDVNITGVFLCSQILGTCMAQRGSGSIINIASTYGIVAPDQKLYLDADGNQRFYKTAAYPVTKAAVLSLTTYLAAYWGKAGVRVNALSPGGVQNGQDAYFIQNYSARTPLSRMAKPNDYRGAIIFLASDASSYMTGANLIVDGGYTIW